jgi:hypothetical protein
MAGKRPSLPAAKAVLFERVACRKPSYNKILLQSSPIWNHIGPQRQKRMSKILTEIEGVVCMMNDILVFGETQASHNNLNV